MNYLHNTLQNRLMRMCAAVAGSYVDGARWYSEMPLVDVYHWNAIMYAEIDEGGNR